MEQGHPINTNAIRRYAPKARTAFIAAMSKRAALLGIRESSMPSLGIAPLEIRGDLALISDSSGTQRTFPANVVHPRAALAKKVEQQGFALTMEQAAYSYRRAGESLPRMIYGGFERVAGNHRRGLLPGLGLARLTPAPPILTPRSRSRGRRQTSAQAHPPPAPAARL